MTTGCSLVVAAMVGLAAGHGAMTFPKPRNSLDGVIEPWAKWAYPCDETHKGDDCAITFCENGQVCAHSHVGQTQSNLALICGQIQPNLAQRQ
jgi:hypothetical protein